MCANFWGSWHKHKNEKYFKSTNHNMWNESKSLSLGLVSLSGGLVWRSRIDQHVQRPKSWTPMHGS